MKKVSFVIPCYRSEKTIAAVVDEIAVTMAGAADRYTYEIILVNDCSPDNTFSVIRTLTEAYPNIVGIDLAKNFGQHAALMAGYRHTTGDYVVSLDDDGQTPADEVLKLLSKLEEENQDVVYASYESKKHSAIRNFGSKVNGKMTEIMLNKPKELMISSYFVARRFIIDEILRYENSYPYVIGLVLRSTKRIANVPVKHRSRTEGSSGYSMKKLLSLWVNGFTSFSVKPLRIATISGVLFAIIGMLYLVYIILNHFISGGAPIGWSTTIAIMLLIGGLVLLILGLIGEYIGRIYICINHSPQYVIRETVTKKESDE